MSKKHVEDIIKHLKLFPISNGYRIDDFSSSVDEYKEFLSEKALENEINNISKTHLLVNIKNGDIVAYITLSTGSIKLNQNEKDNHGVPSFTSYPSMKIAKLAVDCNYNCKFKGIGKLMVDLAIGFMDNINKLGVACRFLEVDADIENNETVTEFYEKCGFVYNQMYKKKAKAKTVSMRLDDTI